MNVAAQAPAADYEYAWRITAERAEVEGWRRQVARAARALGADQDTVDVARLAASELLANVCRHVGAGTTCQLVVEREGAFLCVRLSDTSRETPRVTTPDPLSEAGRGLWLLRELATDLGYLLTPTGKWVWVHCLIDTHGFVPEPSPSTRNGT